MLAHAAHMALAMLCCPEKLQILAHHEANFVREYEYLLNHPSHADIPTLQTLITQNIDGLSTRALNDVLANLKRDQNKSSEVSMIYEMHGRLFDTICTSCERVETDYTPSLCSALSETQSGPEMNNPREIPVHLLPRCKQCGGLLRPGVVWFDEKPRHMSEIWSLVDKADMCLVIGTSNTVKRIPK